MKSEGVPKCSCGGIIKPDVVLYEEGLDNRILQKAVEAIYNADMLMIGGPPWWYTLRQASLITIRESGWF